jgi:alkylation response protein AidB-like acyl-CoA dehydrogenase
MENQVPQRGGAFLLEEIGPERILTPEELPADARLMAKTMEEFVRREVLPQIDRLEAHEPGLMRSLLQRAGELGLLSGGLPERYGGLDLPKSTLALLTEKAADYASFSISLGVHAGVSMFPLLFFGTEVQKQRYLPGLASGERIGAYALSEANSGSDALSAQTKAALTSDGTHYLLNGTKFWITNAGFADLFTVFARVDGEQFTAFLVERDFPGVSVGPEEHKLGLHGSSTCRLILENAQVPVENVLGEIGKGHRPALYALNMGRFNIGVGALGASKALLKIATQYAKQRVQFGWPIAQFGLIQQKLAEMAMRIFVLESMVYRVAGYWDTLFGRIDAAAADAQERLQAASEEYAIECAVLKFVGTEVLDYVVDETLQIHGGFGYSEEFPVARAYRDARVHRIFEGTNEINRLNLFGQVRRRWLSGRLDITQALESVKSRLAETIATGAGSVAEADEVAGRVRQIREMILYTLGQAWESWGERLSEQQEVSAALADMEAALFALESAWLRCRKRPPQDANLPPMLAATQVYAHDACAQVERWARTIFASLGSEVESADHLQSLQTLLPRPFLNTIALRRQVAAAVLEREGYPW